MITNKFRYHLHQKTSPFLSCVMILFSLLACEPAENVPVQKLDINDLVSNTDLEILQEQQLQDRSKKGVYHFGFDLRNSPQEDASQYLPFLKYLEASTGYQFKLHFTPKNSSTVHELGNNNIQFAAMGAVSYLQADALYNAISLVRGINLIGQAEYQSMLVVRPESKIKKIWDLKGRSLAFGSRDSTQGHLIPRIMLEQSGLKLTDLKKYTYTGSHQNCAEAVVSGSYDVCGMQDQLAKLLSAQGQLRVIHISRYYPSSGIVASSSLPKDVIDRVKQALLEFDPEGRHKKGLHNWALTEMPKGFIDSTQRDYEQLYSWLRKLDLIQVTKEHTE